MERYYECYKNKNIYVCERYKEIREKDNLNYKYFKINNIEKEEDDNILLYIELNEFVKILKK
jgi:hypothetical protein